MPLEELEAKEHGNVDVAQVQTASLKKQGHWVDRPRRAESMPTAEEVKESEADHNGVFKLAESNRIACLFMAACGLTSDEEGLLVFHVPVDAQDKEVESRKDSWRIVLASKLVLRRTSTSSSATDTRASSPPPSSSRPDDVSSKAKTRRCPPPVLSIIHRNREHRTPLRSFVHLPVGASPSLQMYRTLRDVMRSWSEIKRTHERFVMWEREAPCLLGVKLMLRKQDDEVIKGLADVPEILWASTLQKAIAEGVRSTLERESWWDEVD
ncbi:hypothetical protein B0A49_01221 [Cryomyces minteri]|uniref:Uncharacterized protein n=1 Tax=Cryomyces minteri TaxID=331657 RepID=A0A4U0XNW7_9PEZI|nr:hypothetical protein B0A49_01221 [Cryomyces minteri]